MWDFINYLIIGVLVGSIYGLIALGFVIINKDHRKEGLDRILVHLDNQVCIFIHRL